MKLYLAPLEGITNHIYRKALYECFGGFDKYFIPFIRAKQNLNFSGREKKDIDPENNQGMYAVPQILTRNAEDFLRTASQLAGLGYREINLNLGCPSKTVVTKGCGAGFIESPYELERFLDHIFANTDLKISIKTRLGMDDAEEFEDLLEIYNRFPLEELIVHPRVQKDFYKNIKNLEAIEYAVQKSKNPLCYNGDIFSAEDAINCLEQTKCDGLMLARGVRGNPWLFAEIKQAIMKHDAGEEIQISKPQLSEVVEMIRRHGRMQAEYKGEIMGMREMRKHIAWYTTGYPHSAAIRREANFIETYEQLEKLCDKLLQATI